MMIQVDNDIINLDNMATAVRTGGKITVTMVGHEEYGAYTGDTARWLWDVLCRECELHWDSKTMAMPVKANSLTIS